DDKMIGRLILAAVALPEFAAGEERRQHLPNIAVGCQKSIGEPLDECRRRLVGDKILRQLEADMAGCRRAFRQNVKRLLAFGLAARAQRMTEEDLGAEIMASALENRGVIGQFAHVPATDSASGEDARQVADLFFGV